MDEKIILQTQPTVIPTLVIYPATATITLIVFLIPITMLAQIPILALLYASIGIIFFSGIIFKGIIEFAKLQFTTYTLTNKRIIVEHGILSRTRETITLDKVKGTAVRQPLVGRIFNYGTVIVQTWTNEIRLPRTSNTREWEETIKQFAG